MVLAFCSNCINSALSGRLLVTSSSVEFTTWYMVSYDNWFETTWFPLESLMNSFSCNSNWQFNINPFSPCAMFSCTLSVISSFCFKNVQCNPSNLTLPDFIQIFDLKKSRYFKRNGGHIMAFFWHGRCGSCLFSYWNEICHSINFRTINILTCPCVCSISA